MDIHIHGKPGEHPVCWASEWPKS